MEAEQSVLAVREALWLALQLGGPVLVAMLLVGIIVAVLQALTQVQEASLAFLPKLMVVAGATVLLGPGMAGALRAFAGVLFDRVVAVGGLH